MSHQPWRDPLALTTGLSVRLAAAGWAVAAIWLVAAWALGGMP